ncbi:hypothetical protein CDAR_39141 [Caerostris darwini]|uniref:Uncharacterized protein n=1 Tax=Caerostris darwini TaxID=1538125 RepID=A0AAV4UR46_9ARAC|nr:hypothetical protein CDAR_39141 [Caerostris darwini]
MGDEHPRKGLWGNIVLESNRRKFPSIYLTFRYHIGFLADLGCLAWTTLADLLAKEGTSDVPIPNDTLTLSEICSKIKTSNQQLWNTLSDSSLV